MATFAAFFDPRNYCKNSHFLRLFYLFLFSGSIENQEAGMKRFFVFFILFAVLALTGCSRSAAVAIQPVDATAELSFSFTRQSGFSSNQFAVWVEDAQGRHVNTLYATRFTANGGWKKRETSIPTWVKQSGLADMPKAELDSLSGATPKTGAVAYFWDGTDSRNTALPPGDYTIFLEGTLRGENQVVYRAVIRSGQGAAVPEVTAEYIGTPPGNEREMISAVTVRTLR